jgi:hypothetical protein
VVGTLDIALLLAEPEKISVRDVSALRDLITQYPYFQPLRLLLAKASLGTAAESETLASAALYTNGQLLHTILHQPENLLKTSFVYELPVKVVDVETEQPIELDEASINEVDEQEIFDEIGEINIEDYRPALSKEDRLEIWF